MSYQITAKVNAGTITVTSSGDVPDGEFIINGHDDGDLVTIAAEQRDALGRYTARATHHHRRSELRQMLDAPDAPRAQAEPQDSTDEMLRSSPAGNDRFA